MIGETCPEYEPNFVVSVTIDVPLNISYATSLIRWVIDHRNYIGVSSVFMFLRNSIAEGKIYNRKGDTFRFWFVNYNDAKDFLREFRGKLNGILEDPPLGLDIIPVPTYGI